MRWNSVSFWWNRGLLHPRCLFHGPCCFVALLQTNVILVEPKELLKADRWVCGKGVFWSKFNSLIRSRKEKKKLFFCGLFVCLSHKDNSVMSIFVWTREKVWTDVVRKFFAPQVPRFKILLLCELTKDPRRQKGCGSFDALLLIPSLCSWGSLDAQQWCELWRCMKRHPMTCDSHLLLEWMTSQEAITAWKKAIFPYVAPGGAAWHRSNPIENWQFCQKDLYDDITTWSPCVEIHTQGLWVHGASLHEHTGRPAAAHPSKPLSRTRTLGPFLSPVAALGASLKRFARARAHEGPLTCDHKKNWQCLHRAKSIPRSHQADIQLHAPWHRHTYIIFTHFSSWVFTQLQEREFAGLNNGSRASSRLPLSYPFLSFPMSLHRSNLLRESHSPSHLNDGQFAQNSPTQTPKGQHCEKKMPSKTI